MKEIVTKKTEETRDLAKKLAAKLKGGEIICLEGDLGSGKTTFSQGILSGLDVEKPYTSPTFLVMKNYRIKNNNIENIYHIDTYRVTAEDVIDLGWEEIIKDEKSVVIVEWPERISEILPNNPIKISFEVLSENERLISFSENI